MGNTFEQQNTKSSKKPEVQKVVIDMGHAWSPEERQKFEPEFRSNEIEKKDKLKENGGRSNKFVSDWEKKFMTTPNVSHEELEELAKSGEEIWNLKFDDDEKYFDLKKQFEAEQEKSPYITKEHEDLAMQIVQTTRGNLESTKKFIDYKFSESQKDIEAKKLQEVRAKIYGEPEDYEVFDPEVELKNINKFTKEEAEKMTPEEKLRLKKNRLEEYKKKLAEQKIGIAQINSELENKILCSKDMDRDDLEKFILGQAKEKKLSKKQLDKYRSIFEKAQKRNAVIKEFSQKFEGRNDDFFEAMFGKKPFGKISIKDGVISFAVVCEDARDYAWIESGKYKFGDDLNLDDNDLERSQSTAGHVLSYGTKIPELRNCVTAINGVSAEKNESYYRELEKTIIHEEKHEVNGLINEEFPDPEKGRHSLKGNEIMAKDEILSFLKGGTDTETMKMYLLNSKDEGGVYDYFDKDKQMLETRINTYISQPGYADNPYVVKDLEEVKKALKNIDTQKKIYERHITDALITINKLEKLNYPREEIVGLFQTENIDKWGKVYERVKNSADFKEKKADLINNLDEEIKSWENSLDIYKKELQEIESYREFQKNLSGFSKIMHLIFRKPEEAILSRKDPKSSKRNMASNEEQLKRLLKRKEDLEKL